MTQQELLKAVVEGKKVRAKTNGALYYIKEGTMFVNINGEVRLSLDCFSSPGFYEIVKEVKETIVLDNIEWKDISGGVCPNGVYTGKGWGNLIGKKTKLTIVIIGIYY